MRTSVAALAVICREENGETQWLAQWNKGWQAFSLVGGHRRDGESFRNCVVREVSEELGLIEGTDFVVVDRFRAPLEFESLSKRAGEMTAYTFQMFDVQLAGAAAWERVNANPMNRWLTVVEIQSRQC